MNPVIDLVFFEGCPHVEEARDALRQALVATGLPPTWREWRSDEPGLPPYLAGFGSPSILVDRQEITGAVPDTTSRSCRVYIGTDGTRRGAPEPAQIEAILRGTSR